MAFDEGWAALHALSKDLLAADEAAARNVKKAAQVSAGKIRETWQGDANRKGLEQYAASIDWEVKEFDFFGGLTVEAEIGPNLTRGVGVPSFGFVEDAPGKVASAPQHAGRDALKAHTSDFLEHVTKAVGESLDGLNL